MKLLTVSLLLVSFSAFATKPPKITGKATEIIKKCADWAAKEFDKKKEPKLYEQKAHECSYKNGVDTKGK